MKPKRFNSKADREHARRIRDGQWALMRRVAELGTLWFCVWNKKHRPTLPDEERCGLIDGMEYLEWMGTHPDWWIQGEWSDERYAFPLQLTDAGRTALEEWEKYDLEPVTGGMVEPGWVKFPSPRLATAEGGVDHDRG